MSLSISLGPLALPVAPLVVIAAVWLSAWLAERLARQRGADARQAEKAGTALFLAAGLGLLVARLVHLGLHAEAYLAQPGAMLDLRDGGWHAPSGWVAAAVALAAQAWRHRALRRALGLAGLAGGLFWGGTTAWLGRAEPPALPALVLERLGDGQATDLPRAAAGRPAVVNLWASWCGPCREEMPALAAAQRRHPDVAVLFVNQGEAPAVIEAYLATLPQRPQDVLLDGRAALGPAVGSVGLPTTLFYDASGRQVDAHFGVLNAAALASRLERLARK